MSVDDSFLSEMDVIGFVASKQASKQASEMRQASKLTEDRHPKEDDDRS